MEGVLAIIGIFGSFTAIMIVPRYLKSIERQKLQDTIRLAIEKGQPLPLEVIEAVTHDVKVRSAAHDLRTGIIWLGMAAGLATLAVIAGREWTDALYPLLGIAAFPGFVGLAFLILALVSGKKA